MLADIFDFNQLCEYFQIHVNSWLKTKLILKLLSTNNLLKMATSRLSPVRDKFKYAKLVADYISH